MRAGAHVVAAVVLLPLAAALGTWAISPGGAVIGWGVVLYGALPITLGLGVDYAINVAHRHRQGGDPAETLRTSGRAVSLTCPEAVTEITFPRNCS